MEDSFDLKDESRRANQELFETTGSTARRNHYVEAMQFRKHVEIRFTMPGTTALGFRRINVRCGLRYPNGEHVILINASRV